MSAAGAAGVAAILAAIKASGTIVRVDREVFLRLLSRNPGGLVVHSKAGFLYKGHAYLTSYKGLAFYTKTDEAIPVPGTTELIEASRIWVP